MPIEATVTLNARIQPLDRDRYEDPLLDALAGRELYDIVGGGSQLLPGGNEIEFCCIDLDIHEAEPAIPLIVDTLTQAGAPQGSHLRYTDRSENAHTIAFGKTVGLAIYLNGTDLPDEVYAECDVNHIVATIDELLEGFGSYQSYWEGPTETALYLYGSSHTEMRQALSGFLADYPLCQKARLVDLPTAIEVVS
ncbi:hypothetical protein [Bremerella alba]|uniref:Uncharacterized protein n=1 Tax=Bremerella alba TaxID=980252 RepID=A0A7V9A980_9BACT|nr:hypothetical protein [Bremerella alba]MBA2116871.1 hypothetical protein [Bremerella alba]